MSVIHLGSDLHLEFERAHCHTLDMNTEGDVLLLAGDIFGVNCDARRTDVAHQFFEDAEKCYDRIYTVMGNHEHYHGYFNQTRDQLEKFYAFHPKVRLLDNHTVEEEDFILFGATMWTDMNKSDPLVMWDVQRGMNDFNCIHWGEEASIAAGHAVRFRVEDAINENAFTVSKLREFMSIETDKRRIIMTHHAPSWDCVEGHYKHDTLSFGYACTNLSDLFFDEENFVWVHGHMHRRYRQPLYKGEVMCNARGYVGEYGLAKDYRFVQV